MSYDTTKLNLMVPSMGSAPALWDYTSGDARTSVEGASYFSDALQRGLKLGDTVIVGYTTGYVTTVHKVASVSGSAATINAAVLA